MNKMEMENRLVDFSVKVVESVEILEKRGVNVHLKDQIIRSATACALNYGEAQSAESRKDFIHKLGIVMKELRETQINLKMIDRLNAGLSDNNFPSLIKENDGLLAIFYRMIETARKKELIHGRWKIFQGRFFMWMVHLHENCSIIHVPSSMKKNL